MRLPGWKVTTSLGAVLVLAAAGITGWQLRWPPVFFKSAAPVRPSAREFLLPRVGTTSVTPYRLGKDLYVNDVAAWRRLPGPGRSALLSRLHVAEQRFQLLRAHGFPSPPPLTARAVGPGRGSNPGSAPAPVRHATVLTSWASSKPIPVTEDIGAAAVGDRSFSAGDAAYSGLTFAPFLGWVPCASDPTTSFGKPIRICGGQVLATGTVSRPAGMSGLTVLAKGMAIGQAGLPLLASYTNHSTHAQKVTVTGTVASVTMTLATAVIGAGCHESFLEYGTPARGSSPLGRLVPPLPEPPLINVDGCLGSFHFTAPIPSIQTLSKIFGYVQTAITTADDSLDTANHPAQLTSAPAVKICQTGRLAADLGQFVTDLFPAYTASLSCQPRVLPRWTGTVPAGATVQFGAAPVARALSSQFGFEIAGLYSLAHLHLTSQCSGPACPVTGRGAVPAVYVADQGSGTVTPISTATNTPGAPIHVGRQPIAIAVTPDGKTVYVVNNADSTVTQISTATNIPGSPIQVGGNPTAIAVTPDGKDAYVSSSIPGTVTPISTSTNVPSPSIRAGEALFGIAITPDGKTAYAADTASSTVIPINLATSTPGTPINVGQLPSGVAISPDGKTVYITNYGDSAVTPIDVATNTPRTPIHVGKHPHGIAITH